MPPRTAPPTVDDSMPAIDLKTILGEPVQLPLSPSVPTLVYFMRTPTCPVCHAHLRSITRSHLGSEPLAAHTVVIVPGDPEAAQDVEARHPKLAGRIYASESAHEAVGLFVKVGLQQSGSFVVSSERRVLSARSATVPLGSYDQAEVLAALEGVHQGSACKDSNPGIGSKGANTTKGKQ